MAMAEPMTSCMSEPMMASSTISHRMIRGACGKNAQNLKTGDESRPCNARARGPRWSHRRGASALPGRAVGDPRGLAAGPERNPRHPRRSRGGFYNPNGSGGRFPRGEAPRSSAGDASCAGATTNPRVGEAAEPRRAGDGTGGQTDRGLF